MVGRINPLISRRAALITCFLNHGQPAVGSGADQLAALPRNVFLLPSNSDPDRLCNARVQDQAAIQQANDAIRDALKPSDEVRAALKQ